jgi:hypothetical protein
LYCYDIHIKDITRHDSGERVVVISRMSIGSRITLERKAFMTALTYFGGVDLRCSVQDYKDKAKYVTMKQDLLETFAGQSATDLIRKMDGYFPESYFRLQDLFMDRRRNIVDLVTRRMYEEQAGAMERFYKKNRDLARLLASHEAQIPDTFLAAAQFVLNRMLVKELEKLSKGVFPDQLQSVVEEMRFWNVQMPTDEAERLIRDDVLKLVQDLLENPWDEHLFMEIKKFLALARDLDLHLDLSEPQIMFLRLVRSLLHRSTTGLPPYFTDLAEILSVRIHS